MNQIQPQPNQPLAMPFQPVTTKDHLEKFKDARFEDDLGPIQPGDIGITFLKVCQQMSREVNQGMPLGMPFLTGSSKAVPPGSYFCVLLRRVSYIHWEKSEEGKLGKMLWRGTDPKDPYIRSIKGLDWIDKILPTGEKKRIPPAVTEYINFYIALPGVINEPVNLPFKRTSMPKGKELLSQLIRLRIEKNIPTCGFVFRIKPSIAKQLPNGQTNYLFDYEHIGQVPEDQMPKMLKLRDMAEAMSSQLTEQIMAEENMEEAIDAEGEVIYETAPQQYNQASQMVSGGQSNATPPPPPPPPPTQQTARPQQQPQKNVYVPGNENPFNEGVQPTQQPVQQPTQQPVQQSAHQPINQPAQPPTQAMPQQSVPEDIRLWNSLG